jgi:thiamine biosynthesis lipoprotein
MRYQKVCLFVSTILLLTLASCRTKTLQPITKENFLLGTIIKISLYDQDKNNNIIFNKVFDRIREVESKMTINQDQSEIISLNKASGVEEVRLSPDTFYVLEKGKHYSQITEGNFDITIGPIVKLWNIGTEHPRVPSPDEIKGKLPLVNFRLLRLNPQNHSAYLEKKGMIVDLGGIAKGYAADEAKRILKEEGVQHAIVNLGGNIMTIGAKPDGSPWKIGIQNPFNPRGDYMGIVEVKDQAVVTSGVYERYFEKNGKRYHHILNPKTGYPVENGLVSVTIITPVSVDADGLSTSLFTLGLEEGMKFIEGKEEIEAIFIREDRKVFITSGLKESFKIADKTFILQ